MTIPVWNSDWEKPDPLRGKRGWTLPDYVNIGVAVGLVVVASGLLLPAAARSRVTDSRLRWVNADREQQLAPSLPDVRK
jgi:hypothetical protein